MYFILRDLRGKVGMKIEGNKKTKSKNNRM